MTKVTVYSTPTCVYCKMAKQYFDENNVSYEDIDVGADQEAANKMVEKSGQMGVPVIVIENEGKEEVLVGFDKPKINEALGLEK